jgi:hypothetical protein
MVGDIKLMLAPVINYTLILSLGYSCGQENDVQSTIFLASTTATVHLVP